MYKSLLAGVVCFSLSAYAADVPKAEPAKLDLEALKSSVLHLEINVAMALDDDTVGSFVGTGFILDNKLGLLATNHHVADFSPSRIRVMLYDGREVAGRVIYTDPWHDFSILKTNDLEILKDFPAVVMKSSSSLNLNDHVTLIGSNGGNEYGIKEGKVTNLSVDKGDWHSASIQTNFDRAGGSSGAPVFNDASEVVGIHYKGSATESWELKIDYIIDAFNQLKVGKVPQRGYIGVELGLIRTSNAGRYYRVPEELRKTKNLLRVALVHAGSASDKILKSGDIVLKLNGYDIADGLYTFDKIVDQSIGKPIKMSVFREDKVLDLEIPKVAVANFEPREFITVAGATFQNIKTGVRARRSYVGEGVMMTQTLPGTSFFDVGNASDDAPRVRRVVILSVNGQTVKDLDSLQVVVKALGAWAPIFVEFIDFTYGPTVQVWQVEFDTNYNPFRRFKLDPESKWVEVDTNKVTTPAPVPIVVP